MCGVQLPDPLDVHKSKDQGGSGLPDPLNLFDSAPGPSPEIGTADKPAAPPAPQAPKMPDQQEARKALQALAAAGYGRAAGNTTSLTGPGGVSPHLLNIGRNTLLGS